MNCGKHSVGKSAKLNAETNSAACGGAALAPMCKGRRAATEHASRLPCVRGGGKTEGFDGRVVSATGDSVYTKQDIHLFN